MKVFSKLKGIFFDEVEDEEENTGLTEEIKIKELKTDDEKEEFKPIVEKPVINEIKEVRETREEKLENPVNDFNNERDLFVNEKPFVFTEFSEPEEELPPRRSVLDLDRREEVVVNNRSREEEYTPRRNIDLNISSSTSNNSDTPKVFKPSPIISPIYGILDKDYKKEEIIQKEKSVNENKIDSKVTTYDSVRRKAYGTLEDDLEDTLNSMNKITTEEVNDKIEDNLADTEDFEDTSKTLAELNEKTQKIENLISKIEEATDEIDRTMSIGELEDTAELENFETSQNETVGTIEEDKTMTDSTLEHDLFNLIDSMYDDKEE